jgi:TetR/AcrR family transcriptional regulator, transcriptional repressor for nem operon
MDQAIQSAARLERMSTASPSPRRLTRKGQETRQRIVSAAADLIFERGVAHTTMEDVRAAADVSSSQLYHYFDDKAALVSAVIEHQTDGIVSNHERLDLSTLEGLRAWRDRVVDYQRSIHYRGGCPIGSLGSELADTDPEARAQVAEGFKRWETAIQSGLREMHAHGRLAPDADPDSLALALLTALQGGLLLAKIERNTKPLEAALDSILELVARLGDAASAKTSVGPR